VALFVAPKNVAGVFWRVSSYSEAWRRRWSVVCRLSSVVAKLDMAVAQFRLFDLQELAAVV
jgi:hypothetical protein